MFAQRQEKVDTVVDFSLSPEPAEPLRPLNAVCYKEACWMSLLCPLPVW